LRKPLHCQLAKVILCEHDPIGLGRPIGARVQQFVGRQCSDKKEMEERFPQRSSDNCPPLCPSRQLPRHRLRSIQALQAFLAGVEAAAALFIAARGSPKIYRSRSGSNGTLQIDNDGKFGRRILDRVGLEERRVFRRGVPIVPVGQLRGPRSRPLAGAP
jgi:hypothetical protein